jgi:hypothetical protein
LALKALRIIFQSQRIRNERRWIPAFAGMTVVVEATVAMLSAMRNLMVIVFTVKFFELVTVWNDIE